MKEFCYSFSSKLITVGSVKKNKLSRTILNFKTKYKKGYYSTPGLFKNAQNNLISYTLPKRYLGQYQTQIFDVPQYASTSILPLFGKV